MRDASELPEGKVEIALQLPAPIVDELAREGNREVRSQVLAQALRAILQGSPAERMAMMQDALPLMASAMEHLPSCPVDKPLVDQFDEYCSRKMVKAEVLLTGALMHALHISVEEDQQTGPPASPREIFLEYSRQRASHDMVIRAVVSYGDWLVPYGTWISHYQKHTSSQVYVDPQGTTHAQLPPVSNLVLFGEEMEMASARSELWLFTDYEAASLAEQKGAAIGGYVGGIRGTDIFRNLNPEWEWVKMNPGSPPEQLMALPRAGFADLQQWAGYIAFEETLEQDLSSNTEVLAELVRAYDGFLGVLIRPDGRFATLVDYGGLANGTMVFTAPDCLKGFTQELDVPDKHLWKAGMAKGAKLVEELSQPDSLSDGIIINPVGPGPTVVLPLSKLRKTDSHLDPKSKHSVDSIVEWFLEEDA
jgi:hypothetical protein